MALVLGCESRSSSNRVDVNATAHSASASASPQSRASTPDTFIGVVVGRYSVDLTPRFDGKISEVHVRLGDHVRKGDLLATLDLPTIQSELRMAEVGLRSIDIERDRTAVELEAAKDQLSRREALGREALATAEDIAAARYRQDLAAMRLEATRATSTEKRVRIDQLRKDAATRELRAPFDGLISIRYVDPGASVTTTTRIVRVISGDDLLVRFAVPESSVQRLEIGLPVEVSIGDQNMQLQANVEKIAPEVDAASRMIVVEAALEKPKSSAPVIAGLMANVKLERR